MKYYISRECFPNIFQIKIRYKRPYSLTMCFLLKLSILVLKNKKNTIATSISLLTVTNPLAKQ